MTPFVRRGSFQARLSAVVALAVGIAVALAASGSYLAVRHQLYSQVNNNMQAIVGTTNDSQGGVPTPAELEAHGVMAGLYLADGRAVPVQLYRQSELELPGFHPSAAQLAVAHDRAGTMLSTNIRIRGTTYRLVTIPIDLTDPQGQNQPAVLIFAQSLGTIEHELADLRLILYIIAVSGILVALGLGRLIARTTIRPVERLTAAAEHVAETQQLDATIHETGSDELGRLAHAFNAMLHALSASRQQQAQLVSDAGHELRTPLTSLRTNVELLVRARNLPDDERAELTTDVIAQLEELTTLIGDLVDLARQEEQQPEPTEVRLDHLVTLAVERAQRRAPSVRFKLDLTAGSVRAQPPLLERAILNVLDNAAKWSPPASTVEVTLTRGERWYLDIRDHGPGIAPEDLTKVFDRFYRAPAARSMPGSGLGLAIVSQVITSHGGTVAAILPPDGGTLVRIELPTVVEQEPDLPAIDVLPLGPPPSHPPAAPPDGQDGADQRPTPWDQPQETPHPSPWAPSTPGH